MSLNAARISVGLWTSERLLGRTEARMAVAAGLRDDGSNAKAASSALDVLYQLKAKTAKSPYNPSMHRLNDIADMLADRGDVSNAGQLRSVTAGLDLRRRDAQGIIRDPSTASTIIDAHQKVRDALLAVQDVRTSTASRMRSELTSAAEMGVIGAAAVGGLGVYVHRD